jgi:hypothetical protein
MKTRSSVLATLVAMLVTGCASGPPLIDVMQPEAMSTATRRAQFDLNCPAGVTATLLSRETIPPISVNFGQERAEYTIGVAGCGKRASYVVICSQFTQGCFAGGGRTVVQ